MAIGVEVIELHLKGVEKVEHFLKRILMLDKTRNVRVRMLLDGKAVVELDILCIDDLDCILREHGFEALCVNEWGLKSLGAVCGFKTGSVAYMPSADKTQNST